MENKRFEHIITRYLKGKATPEEEAELLQAIHASKEWEAAFRKRTAEWNPLEETEADPETDRKFEKYVNSRMEDGKIRILFRDLVKGDTYEHTNS